MTTIKDIAERAGVSTATMGIRKRSLPPRLN